MQKYKSWWTFIVFYLWCNANSRYPKSSVNDKIAPWRNYLLAHTSDHPLGPESPAPTWRYAQPSPLWPALITCATLPSGRLPAYDHFVILIGPISKTDYSPVSLTGFVVWLSPFQLFFYTHLLIKFLCIYGRLLQSIGYFFNGTAQLNGRFCFVIDS